LDDDDADDEDEFGKTSKEGSTPGFAFSSYLLLLEEEMSCEKSFMDNDGAVSP